MSWNWLPEWLQSLKQSLLNRKSCRYARAVARRSRPDANRCLFRPEQLEDRLAPASYAVNAQLLISPLDHGGTANAAPAVVFFESSVADFQVLRQGLRPGTDAVLLDSSDDGLREMAAFLAGRHDLTSIGVVAHGSPGAVELGSTTLESQTLGSYQAALATIGSALGKGGELDLWSCDVAADQQGGALVDELTAALGKGVAASDHPVGSTALGGNWRLDFRTDGAQAAVPFTADARAGFDHLLDGWSAANSMSTPRQDATATLLPNGKILVVGGSNNNTVALPAAELYDPASNTWSLAGNMGTPRAEHTATLLPNGKVLVTGGGSNGTVFSSAELYDPTSNTWSPAGNMSAARAGHTATLLPNGKVLVTGGGSNGPVLFSAELYDPATNTWSSAGNMATVRIRHTATLLPSGKVLVTGGTINGSGSGSLSSAEVYDPASNTWSSTGSMNTARASHTATLLPSGKVLVTGGGNSGGVLASAELYDPIGGTWAQPGQPGFPPSMATARESQTATLLGNGMVLVTGGDNGSSSLSSAELYDPASNIWFSAAPMTTARSEHTATLLGDGKILVAGGLLNSNNNDLKTAELYDPFSNRWSAASSMPTPRGSHTATRLDNGMVLVAGGFDGTSYLSSAELYDPTSNTWSAAGSMTTARSDYTATLLTNGEVLVIGGGNSGGLLASAELYDPASNTWLSAGSMTTARSGYTATLLQSGKVLVTGGYDSSHSPLASAELYDPATNTWAQPGQPGFPPSMSQARGAHTATRLDNGKVLVAGGLLSGGTVALSSAELYDPTTNTWSPSDPSNPNHVPSMNQTRGIHTATLLPSGKVLVAGGANGSVFLPYAEEYDPANNTWTNVGSMAQARAQQTATLLPSGKVLVTGGTNPGILASAELYDPTTKTWSSAASMNTARSGYTATLLDNNLVLVTGGANTNGSFLTSAELYDPLEVDVVGTITTDTPTFSWYPVSGASYYNLVAVDQRTNQVVINTPVNGLSFPLSASQALTPGDSYTWYLGSVINGAVAYNSGLQFTVAPLPAPTPVGPHGTVPPGVNYDTPTFGWDIVPNANHYAILVFDATANNALVIDNTNVTGPAFAPSTPLTPGHRYTWSVWAVNTNGQMAASNLAAPQTFTLAPLAAPTPSGPSGTIMAAAGYDRPAFSWPSVAGANHYALVVLDASAGNTLVLYNTNVSGTSFRPSAAQALTPGHTYTWYVGSVSDNGLVTTFDLNTPFNFTLVPLTAPTPNGPSGNIPASFGYDTPTFSWSSVNGADHYALVVLDNSANNAVVLSNTNVSTTSYPLSSAQALTPGHTYTWYVAAVSTNGMVTKYDLNTPLTFTLAPLAAPMPNGPSGNIPASGGYDRPNFSWSSVAGANHYALVVLDKSANNALVLNNTNVFGTSFRPLATQALTPGHTYTWYVGSVSPNGAVISYDLNTPQTFTLAPLAAPTALSPNGTGTTTPTFRWTTVTGADHYDIVVFDTTNGGQTLVLRNQNATVTSWMPSTPLVSGHRYTWYAGAVSTNGMDEILSSGVSFTAA